MTQHNHQSIMETNAIAENLGGKMSKAFLAFVRDEYGGTLEGGYMTVTLSLLHAAGDIYNVFEVTDGDKADYKPEFFHDIATAFDRMADILKEMRKEKDNETQEE